MSSQDPSQMNNIAAISKLIGLAAPLLFPQTQKQGFGPGPTQTRGANISQALPGLFSGAGDVAEQFAALQDKKQKEKQQPTLADVAEAEMNARPKQRQEPTMTPGGQAVNPPATPKFELPEKLGKMPWTTGQAVPPEFLPQAPPKPIGQPQIKEVPLEGGGTVSMYLDDKGVWKPMSKSDITGVPPSKFDTEKQGLELDKLRSEIKRNLSAANKPPAGLKDPMKEVLKDYVDGKDLSPRQKSALAGWWEKNMEGDVPEDLLGDKKVQPEKKVGFLEKLNNFLFGGSDKKKGETSSLATGGASKAPKKPPKPAEDEDSGSEADWIQQSDGSWVPNPALK